MQGAELDQREGVIEANQNEEGIELARRVGMFMEQYLVPRGPGFIIKAARVYACLFHIACRQS